MPQQKQAVFVPFGQGQDEKTDPRALPPGQWASIVNGQFNKRGRLTQRNGYTSVGRNINTGPNLTAPIQRIIGYNSELLTVDGNSALYSLSSSGAAWAAPSAANVVPPCTVDRVTVFDSTQSQTSPDVATNGIFTVRIWLTNVTGAFPDFRGDLYCAIYDAVTNAIVQQPKLLSSNVGAPRVQVAGNTAVIAAFNGTLGKLVAVATSLTGSAPSFGTSFTVFNPSNPKYNTSYFDFFPLSDRFVFVYQGTNNVNKSIGAFTVDINLSILNQTSINDTAIDTGVVTAIAGVAHSTSDMLIAYAVFGGATGTVATLRLTNTFTLVWGPTTAPAGMRGQTIPYQMGVVPFSSTVALFGYSGASNIDKSGFYYQGFNPTNGSTVGTNLFAPRVFLMSRLWAYNTGIYGLFLANNTLDSGPGIQTSAFILNTSGPSGALQLQVCATIAPRLLSSVGSDTLRVYSDVSNVYSPSSGVYKMLLSGAVDGITQAAREALIEITATFRDSNSITTAPALDTLAIGCGVPSYYDGMRVGEMGFTFYPEVGLTNAVISVSAGGGVDNGTHSYSYVYEFIDARGQRHWSAPSPPTSATTGGGNNTITLKIPCLQLTNRQDVATRIGIVIYRTAAGGGIFYRLTPDAVPNGNLNVFGTPYITYVDTAADSTINTNPLLYTTSGELPNFCPPSARIVCSHKQRLFLAGTDEGRTLWYSKYMAQGFAPAFNDALTIYFSSGGAITGLASLDDKLVVFKSDRIFILYGDGPQDNGVGADWQIQTVATDGSGCIASNSITITDEGVWFQAKRGIMLLDRGLNLRYIGAPVEDAVQGSTVTSATSLTANSQIRFSLNNGVTGAWVIYDSFQKAWSKWTIADSDAGFAIPIGLGTLWNGTFYWQSVPGGSAYAESATSGVDGAAPYFITMLATSGHIALNGLSGFQRVRRLQVLSDVVTQTNMLITLNPDYGSRGTQTYTFNTVADRFEIMPFFQKCSAFQFTLSTSATTAETSGPPEFIGVELECLFDSRLYKGIRPANRG